jgi:hypothetical protein
VPTVPDVDYTKSSIIELKSVESLGVEIDVEPSSKRQKMGDNGNSSSQPSVLSMVKAIAYLAPILGEAIDS